jgi:uncharacterized protein
MIDIRETKEGLQLDIYVQPGAKKTAIIGEYDGRLKISVNQPPDKGRANEAVLELLSKALRIPKSNVTILRGHTSRQKTVVVQGCDAKYVVEFVARQVTDENL